MALCKDAKKVEKLKGGKGEAKLLHARGLNTKTLSACSAPLREIKQLPTTPNIGTGNA